MSASTSGLAENVNERGTIKITLDAGAETPYCIKNIQRIQKAIFSFVCTWSIYCLLQHTVSVFQRPPWRHLVLLHTVFSGHTKE